MEGQRRTPWIVAAVLVALASTVVVVFALSHDRNSAEPTDLVIGTGPLRFLLQEELDQATDEYGLALMAWNRKVQRNCPPRVICDYASASPKLMALQEEITTLLDRLAGRHPTPTRR